MPTNLAEINITNLRLRTYIGFKQEEKENKQDVVINVCIKYQMGSGITDDLVEDALNYRDICKRIIGHVETGRFLLLEKLVSDLLAICREASSVNHARVTVDKPHALRFADSVSISLEYQAARQPQLNVLEKAS